MTTPRPTAVLTQDAETRSHASHAEELRLWLRLFTCTQAIERTVRIRLREEFATTLPRFDLMAQLERHPEGLTMGALSRRLMVTNGNITGITRQLTAEGLLQRSSATVDKRSSLITLTALGLAAFGAMARAHEDWIVQAFAALAPPQLNQLHALLGQLKQGLSADAALPTRKAAP